MGFEQIKVELQDHMGSDKAIAECAWTSSYTLDKKEDKSPEQVAKLVEMLANEQHGVPFEAVIFRFWARIPKFVDEQLKKHRLSTQNGMSGRYRTMPDEFYFLPDDVKAILNKAFYGDDILNAFSSQCLVANQCYTTCLDMLKQDQKEALITNAEYKRCREVLRGMLPQGNMTETTFIFNLRSLANFFKQRSDWEHAQPEIAILSDRMQDLVELSGVCPVAFKVLKKNGWRI
jgi:thymidylate synthase (FAD)